MIKINRRDFLKFIGAGGVGAGAGILYGKSTQKTVELLIPQVLSPEEYSPGIATWYNTVCRQCGAGCGISVRTREGRAKKIEGNPLHPVNQGRLCAMGQAGLNSLYNPDRIRTPLKRKGARGSDSFTEISWDEALTTLGLRLGNLKIKNQGDSVYFLTNGVRGHLDKLFETFMDGLGSSNYLQYDFTFPFALYEANKILFGQDTLPYYDIKNTNFLLSFGADYLGTWVSPVHYSLAYGHLRQGNKNKRGKCVQIEPRMSLSGASADEWINCKPGTEGLLAMAMIHTIINDGVYSGSDLETWKTVASPYSPSTISKQCDVDEAVIIKLARDFIKQQPALAIGGGTAASGTNAVDSLVAINALNYLGGNPGKPGGLLFNTEPVFPNKSLQRHASYTRMLEFITALTSNKVDTLLLHNTNPVFTLPGAAGITGAFKKVPYIASLSSFMDETTAMADLVLPVHTYLEDWGDDIPEPGVGFPIASISQPVVKPVFNSQSAGDIILTLAHQIGGELPAVMPWTNTLDFLKASWKEIYQEQKPIESIATGFDKFWKEVLASGVWGEKKSQPVTGFDQLSEDQITKVHVEQPAFAGEESDFPFVLLPYLTQTFHDGRGANLPWLQELPDPMTSIVYGSWVELNPETAKQMGIREGDVLEVQTPAGSIKAPAFIFEAIRPDVIAMPIGQGHTQYGRYAKNRGANPIGILAPQIDEKSGALAVAATRVMIKKTGQRTNIIKTDGVTRTLGRQILDDKSTHA